MTPRVVLVAALLVLGAAAPRAEELPISRDEALTWLASVEKAYAREDLGRLLATCGNEMLEQQIRLGVGRLFQERNYFKLRTRLLDFAPRPDGSVEIEFLEVLRSRPAESRSDLREKSRRRLRLQRRDGEIVVIDAPNAHLPLLPDVGQWSPELWTGSVELLPRPLAAFGSPEGDARVQVRLRLRNLSPSPSARVDFGLHPFVSEMRLTLVGGPEVTALRHEGTADAWSVDLPGPVAAGEAVEFDLDYSFDEVGEGANARIGPDGAHLFAEGAWLPLFSPTPVPGADRASHDVTIVVPAGWSAVAPGELVGEKTLSGGRRAWRWRSRFPGEAVVVVAGELERRDLRLSQGLTLDSWTQPGLGPEAPEFVEALRSMTSHLEGLLGPEPASRVTLVRSLAPGLRAQPAFLVVDGRDVLAAEHLERRRERQPLFFLAHQLAHLWLQDGVRPIGGPAQIITEGLCDHLAFDWTDAAVDPRMSLWHRDRILQLARGKPSADRPILITHPGAPDHDVFGAGKTLVVLDGFRSFAGPERWASILRDYAQGSRGQQVGVGELLAAFGAGDARLESYVSSWIVGEGFADIAVHEPTAREVVDEASGRTMYEVELVVENLGLGPAPVELRVLEDEVGAPWRTELLELGSLERTVLNYRLDNPLRMVEADQRLLTWQSATANDTFPERKAKPKSFKGQRRKVSPEEQSRLEELMKN